MNPDIRYAAMIYATGSPGVGQGQSGGLALWR
jgi:hypothetical protein